MWDFAIHTHWAPIHFAASTILELGQRPKPIFPYIAQTVNYIYASICFKWLEDELIATIMIWDSNVMKSFLTYKIALRRASTLVGSLPFKIQYLICILNVEKTKLGVS